MPRYSIPIPASFPLFEAPLKFQVWWVLKVLHLHNSVSLKEICFIIMILLLASFFYTSFKLMVFYWNLSDSNTLQVSRTLLRILDDRNNAVVWMVSAHPPISNFSSSSSSLWGPFEVRQLQMVSLSTSCSSAFLIL